MAHFEHSRIINAQALDLFDFVTKPFNLGAVLPNDYKVLQVPDAMPLKKGAEFAARISRYGISVEWRIVIEDFEPGVFYRYRQAQGPYSYWVHTERFDAHAEGTLVTEIIDFELPFGVLGKLAEDLIMPRELNRVFEHRADVLGQLVGSKNK